jgi:hypothetical protein
MNITINIAQKMRRVKLLANAYFYNYLVNRLNTKIIVAVSPAMLNMLIYSIASVAIAFADSLFVVLILMILLLYYKLDITYF